MYLISNTRKKKLLFFVLDIRCMLINLCNLKCMTTLIVNVIENWQLKNKMQQHSLTCLCEGWITPFYECYFMTVAFLNVQSYFSFSPLMGFLILKEFANILYVKKVLKNK